MRGIAARADPARRDVRGPPRAGRGRGRQREASRDLVLAHARRAAARRPRRPGHRAPAGAGRPGADGDVGGDDAAPWTAPPRRRAAQHAVSVRHLREGRPRRAGRGGARLSRRGPAARPPPAPGRRRRRRAEPAARAGPATSTTCATYRPGDDPRLIHWRSERQDRACSPCASWRRRRRSTRGSCSTARADAARLERGLSDAASVAAHLVRGGARVELVGPGIAVPLGHGRAHLRADPRRARALRAGGAPGRGPGPPGRRPARDQDPDRAMTAAFAARLAACLLAADGIAALALAGILGPGTAWAIGAAVPLSLVGGPSSRAPRRPPRPHGDARGADGGGVVRGPGLPRGHGARRVRAPPGLPGPRPALHDGAPRATGGSSPSWSSSCSWPRRSASFGVGFLFVFVAYLLLTTWLAAAPARADGGGGRARPGGRGRRGAARQRARAPGPRRRRVHRAPWPSPRCSSS